MHRTGFVVVGALSCASVACADWVGGALVTDAAWNAQATAALGQQASVFRLFYSFNSSGERMLNAFDVNMDAKQGLLYQDAAGGDVAPDRTAALTSSTLRWDSYVSAGNLFAPTATWTDPSFHFSATGLDDPIYGNGSGWFANPGISMTESVARAPGSADDNGDIVIPAGFDNRFSYVFYGQFTVLGMQAAAFDPVWDLGLIYSPHFEGTVGRLTYFDADGVLGQTRTGGAIELGDIAIGVPSPGGASAMLLTLGAIVTRRRR
ncbi:MAG: hypothetical protein ACF8QF_11340 [Phycisphaerales bacterium]